MGKKKQNLVFLYNPNLSKYNRDLLENSFCNFNLEFVEYKKKNYVVEEIINKILWNIFLYLSKHIVLYFLSLVVRNNPKLKKKFYYYKIMFREKIIELKNKINPTEEIILRIDIDDFNIRINLLNDLQSFYKNIKPNAFKDIYTFGKRKKLLFVIWIGMNRFIISETKKLIYYDDENYKKEEFDNIDELINKFLNIKKP